MFNQKHLATLVSALLWTLCFPFAISTSPLLPNWVSFLLVWIALIPLYNRLQYASPKQHFIYGYLFGIYSYLGTMFWVYVAMQKYGGLSKAYSMLLTLGMDVLLGLPTAVSFWLAAKISSRSNRWISFAIILSLNDFLRFYFPGTGVPWIPAAYPLHASLTLIQVADLIGIHGLNFFVYMGSFLIAETIQDRTQKSVAIGQTIFGITLLTFLLYGFLRLDEIKNKSVDTPSLQVALLQGNIHQDEKWARNRSKTIFDQYQNMTALALDHGANLVVWPEAAFPFTLPSTTKNIPILQYPESDSKIVIGAATWARINQEDLAQNSAFTINTKGQVEARYDKQRLVPFGEYVPLSKILPMQKIVPSVAGNFAEAPSNQPLSTVKDFPFGVLICYELLYPHLAAEMVAKGAQFLVNITNDAWFDQTSGPFQHVQFGIFRAIETRRPIVRAANTGISAWFDSTGAVHNKTQLFEETIVETTIHPSSIKTLFVQFPYAIPICLLLGLAYLCYRKLKYVGA